MTTASNPENVDVVIVGAGPVGLFQALGLCQKGIKNIRILEKHHELNKLEKSIGINTRVLETFEMTTVVGKKRGGRGFEIRRFLLYIVFKGIYT